MSFQPVPHRADLAPADRRELLFTPAPRLGWVFRDRRELAAPYHEPAPNQEAIQAQASQRAAAAEQALARAWRWAGKPSIVLAIILVVLAGCAKSVSGNFNPGLTAITAVVLCGPGLAYTGWCWLRREQARDLTPEQEYQQAQEDWNQRAARHQAAELARLSSQPEWGSVTCPGPRTDVFGGTLAGWQAMLTVHGASILAERPLLAGTTWIYGRRSEPAHHGRGGDSRPGRRPRGPRRDSRRAMPAPGSRPFGIVMFSHVLDVPVRELVVRKPLRIRNARIFLFGEVVSTLGDSSLWFAMGIWMKELTGSSAYSG